jgi:uncharacterized protein
MRINAFIQRHPVAAYFGVTFVISWVAAFLVVVPHLIQGEAIRQSDGLLMAEVMLLGPSTAGIALAAIVDGRSGLRDLFSRMGCWRAGRWYAALLISPALILIVLLVLGTLISPSYAPNLFPLGLLFGLPAGFLEEIGWTGYAFPKMRSKLDALPAAILLGLIWGMWHLPVVNWLGAAAPHAAYFLPFFLAFAIVMTAMRVLIAWVYSNTGSVLLTQLMHASITGSLIAFGAPRVSSGQETLWYAVYAVALWIVVAVVTAKYGKRLVAQQPRRPKAAQTAIEQSAPKS